MNFRRVGSVSHNLLKSPLYTWVNCCILLYSLTHLCTGYINRMYKHHKLRFRNLHVTKSLYQSKKKKQWLHSRDVCTRHLVNSYSCRNSQRDATANQNFLLFRVYIRLNVFRATHRPSLGAQNCTSSLWFYIRERLLDVVVAGHWLLDSVQQSASSKHNVQQPFTYAKPEAASAVLSGVSPETCRASYKRGIINFDTMLHLVGYLCVNYTM